MRNALFCLCCISANMQAVLPNMCAECTVHALCAHGIVANNLLFSLTAKIRYVNAAPEIDSMCGSRCLCAHAIYSSRTIILHQPHDCTHENLKRCNAVSTTNQKKTAQTEARKNTKIQIHTRNLQPMQKHVEPTPKLLWVPCVGVENGGGHNIVEIELPKSLRQSCTNISPRLLNVALHQIFGIGSRQPRQR